MNIRHLILPLLALPCLAQWPQAAGPNGNWQTTGKPAVNNWSVARNQNILWRTTLPNGGQSGIAVFANRIFLTTFQDGEKAFSGYKVKRRYRT